VIVAAGRGERLGSPKQFLPLGGIPLLMWSVRVFDAHPGIDEVVVVLPAEEAPSAGAPAERPGERAREPACRRLTWSRASF
jgi:2-C-methyl-D-erythritol 4-phosphate cytidylyltransferase